MSNQETNTDILKNTLNTNESTIRKLVESQTRILIEPAKAAQLAAAHHARADGRKFNLEAGTTVAMAELVVLAPSLIIDIVAMGMLAIEGGLSYSDVMKKFTEESLEIELNKIMKKTGSVIKDNTKGKIKAAFALIDWAIIMQEYYLANQLKNNKMTPKEYEEYKSTYGIKDIDTTKNSVWNHINMGEILSYSSVLSAIDSGANLTAYALEEVSEALQEAKKKGDEATREFLNQFIFQNTGIENWFSKNTEADSTDLVALVDLEPLEVTYNSSPEPEPIEFETDYDLVSAKQTMYALDLSQASAPTCQPSLLSKIGDGLNRVNPLAILKAKKEQALEKQRLAYAKSMKEYKAHIQRSIDRDPSMEYFYSSKYQDEHQNMFGTISCSNINPSEANNFSSPVGGSFTSPFSSLSNEIAPFKIPPFLTIDDILRNPKFKEFAQNIAGNEAHKQLCSYDRELHESFQDESPLSDEDRSTMEDMHDLVDCLRKYES